MNFEHFILTEFSVLHGTTGTLPTEEWLQHRWPLFERYCAASVARQTSREFKWVIAISPRNPSWVRSKIELLGFKEVLVMEIDKSPTAEDYADFVLRNSATDLVLTSRLDNDDALGPRFVENLRSTAVQRPLKAYNFPEGLQLTGAGLLRVNWRNGPFVSLMEDKSSGHFGTVLQYQHDFISDSVEVIQVRSPDSWLQLVHGRNIGNEATGYPTGVKAKLSDFPMIPANTKLKPVEYFRQVHPFAKLWHKGIAKVRFAR